MGGWRSPALAAVHVAWLAAGCFLSVPALVEEGAGGAGGGGGAGGALCTPGTFLSCYDGPAATKGIGACLDGTAECMEDGSHGACLNQVLPSIERCNTRPAATDEDCNHAENEHCAAWAAQYGKSGNQGIDGLALATSGDLLISGPTTGGLIDFGDGDLLPKYGTRSFVARLDPSRRSCPNGHCWSAILGYPSTSSATSRARAVAESSLAEDVLLAGSFTKELELTGKTATALGTGKSVFVAKLTGATGVAKWISAYGSTGSSNAELYDVATLPAGAVVAVGFTAGTVNFGSTAGSVTATGEDIVAVSLNTTGVAQWAHVYGEAGNDSATRLLTDADGNIYVTGYFATAADFGCASGPLMTADADDAFVAKLDASGDCLWSIALGGPDAQHGEALALADDKLYVGVVFAGSVSDAEGSIADSAGDEDVLLTVRDLETGARLEHHVFGGSGKQEVSDLSLGPGGTVAVAMSINGTVDFGGGVIEVPDVGGAIDDAAVLVLEANGSYRFARSFGGLEGDDDVFQVAFNPQGRLWASGEFEGSMDVGTGVLFSNGVDAYLLRIDDP